MRRLKRVIFLTICLILLPFLVAAQSISLSADSEIVQINSLLDFAVSAEGSFDSLQEPDFNGFEVENRSQSQSNSINIVNGKVERSRSVTYSYALRAQKAGVFKIGPAVLKLKNGKIIKSNVVTITVLGGGASSNQNRREEDILNPKDENGAADDNYYEKRANSLTSPLSEWEKRTPNYFIRTIINQSGEIYQGEPITISYYLFVKPGTISDVNFYKLPIFDNCWKDEKGETRLNFKRLSIDGRVYDYALIKTYVLIPGDNLKSVKGTQMIMDVVIGSFFNMRKQTISSIGINAPLSRLPEAELHPDGKFGNFNITVNKKSIDLDKDNLLETLTFQIKGCGNFSAAEIKLESNDNLKIFAPEIDSKVNADLRGYCGVKSYKFIIKGLKKGKTSIKMRPLEFYSRENGWVKLELPEIPINIKEISAVEKDEEAPKLHRFELLKELPQNVKSYEIKPLPQRSWFKILLGIPFFISCLSFIYWITKNFKQKQSKSFKTKLEKWEENIAASADNAELLNNFYSALSELYNLKLKGERKNVAKQKYGGKIEQVADFVKKIEYATYSGQEDSNLEEFKLTAKSLLNFKGGKK